MVLNYNKKALMELYARNESQKERLKAVYERLEIAKDIHANQKEFLYGKHSGIKGLIRKLLVRALLPYWEEQQCLIAHFIDEIELLYGMEEASIAERESILDWLKFDELAVDRYRALEDRRERIENSTSRVVQFCQTLNFGDAVGNDVLTIQRALDEEGIPNAIYAYRIHEKIPLDAVFYYDEMPRLTSEDLLIYHCSIDDPFMNKIGKFACRVILRYHNITPPIFFEKYNKKTTKLCKDGLKKVKEIADDVDYVMADSEFNKNDLLAMGYHCGMDVVPILIPFHDYDKKPDSNIVKKYSDGWTNIIFVGRVAPNKCFEDIIRCFQTYKNNYNATARLILVGKYDDKSKYYLELLKQVQDEQMQDVIFTGHTSFEEILAYYHVADAFLCMSEHEGFCVPLLEAMYLNVPILAYHSTAIPYTLGEAGVLLECKKPEYVADKINELLKNPELQQHYIQMGKEHLKKYQYDVIKQQILSCIYKNREI